MLYQKLLAESFKADFKDTDFESEAGRDKVREDANSWVNNATKGLIRDILPKDLHTPCTVLLLANAIYFKGTWLQEFDSISTQKREFYLLNGKTVDVPFMTNNARHLYRSYESFKLLKMQYDNHEDAR